MRCNKQVHRRVFFLISWKFPLLQHTNLYHLLSTHILSHFICSYNINPLTKRYRHFNSRNKILSDGNEIVSYKSLLLGGRWIRPKGDDGGSWKSNSAVSTETSVWKRKRTSTPSVTFGDSSLLWGSLCIIPSILPVKMVMKQFGQNKKHSDCSKCFSLVEVTGLEPVTLCL